MPALPVLELALKQARRLVMTAHLGSAAAREWEGRASSPASERAREFLSRMVESAQGCRRVVVSWLSGLDRDLGSAYRFHSRLGRKKILGMNPYTRIVPEGGAISAFRVAAVASYARDCLTTYTMSDCA
jgi:hypothetical protein